MKQKLIILALLLFVIPIGISMAQSSETAILQRFSFFAGERATSTSYSVTSIVGQPLVDSSQSESYAVSSGLLPAVQQGEVNDNMIWLPAIVR